LKIFLLESTIQAIIDKYPETAAVLTSYNILPTEAGPRHWGSILRLKTVLQLKRLNSGVFVNLLLDAIADAGQYRRLANMVTDKPDTFTFAAQLPCALNLPLSYALKKTLEQFQKKRRYPCSHYIWSCSNDVLAYAEYLQQLRDIDKAPDLLFTTEYNLFNENFIERFINKGYYTICQSWPVPGFLHDTGITDTHGWYNVIAVNPVVVVLDCRQLGNLPVPKAWRDLLRPEYEQTLVLNGSSGDFDDIVLLNIYKEYGDAGIAALRRSVRTGMHPSQMIKCMAGSNPDRPPFYVMPYFFARTIASPAETKVIWPEDGTFITPLSFLVKTDQRAEMQELIDFLTGPDFGRICADAYFPSLHPQIECHLPANVRLKWLGWDYIRRQDTGELLAKLNRSFLA
jgi:ABC-type Fe3+ transport system substrate-binding protein